MKRQLIYTACAVGALGAITMVALSQGIMPVLSIASLNLAFPTWWLACGLAALSLVVLIIFEAIRRPGQDLALPKLALAAAPAAVSPEAAAREAPLAVEKAGPVAVVAREAVASLAADSAAEGSADTYSVKMLVEEQKAYENQVESFTLRRANFAQHLVKCREWHEGYSKMHYLQQRDIIERNPKLCNLLGITSMEENPLRGANIVGFNKYGEIELDVGSNSITVALDMECCHSQLAKQVRNRLMQCNSIDTAQKNASQVISAFIATYREQEDTRKQDEAQNAEIAKVIELAKGVGEGASSSIKKSQDMGQNWAALKAQLKKQPLRASKEALVDVTNNEGRGLSMNPVGGD